MKNWQNFCKMGFDLHTARLAGAARQALFPRRCLYCGDIAAPPGHLICPDCEPELPYIRGKRCEKCGKQLQVNCGTSFQADSGTSLQASGQTLNHFCRNCSGHSRSFSFSLALLNYDGISAEIMAGLKYLQKKEYADTLAWLLCRYLGGNLRMLGIRTVVPVPVHAKRRKERGYNQAEELGRSLCVFLNADVPALFRMGLSEEMIREVQLLKQYQEEKVRDAGTAYRNKAHWQAMPSDALFCLRTDIFIRTKNTRAQKNLGAAERLRNLQQAFSVPRKQHRDQLAELPEAVLLLDDIYTTGATMEACTRVLLSAGVQKVFGLCVCAGRDV